MARNHLEETLRVIRNQKAIYYKKIDILEKEEQEILKELQVEK